MAIIVSATAILCFAASTLAASMGNATQVSFIKNIECWNIYLKNTLRNLSTCLHNSYAQVFNIHTHSVVTILYFCRFCQFLLIEKICVFLSNKISIAHRDSLEKLLTNYWFNNFFYLYAT